MDSYAVICISFTLAAILNSALPFISQRTLAESALSLSASLRLSVALITAVWYYSVPAGLVPGISVAEEVYRRPVAGAGTARSAAYRGRSAAGGSTAISGMLMRN